MEMYSFSVSLTFLFSLKRRSLVQFMVAKLHEIFDSISVHSGVRTLSIVKSDRTNRRGFHYFDFVSEFGDTKRAVRIWSNELIRFARLLDRILNTSFDEIDWETEGTFPLDLDLAASGGLGGFVYVGNGSASLVFRRLTATFQDRNGTTGFFKYLNWSRFRRGLSEIRLPVDGDCRGLLTDLSEQLQEEIGSFLNPIAEELGLQYDLSSSRDLVRVSECLTLSGSHDGQQRTTGFDPGCPDLSQFELGSCPVPLLEFILPKCASGSPPGKIARLIDFAVDQESIKRLLSWDVRYSENTLRAGFFAAPFLIPDAGESIVAIRDKSIFAMDPLLLSLLPFGVNEVFDGLDSDLDWVPAPQAPPFEHVLAKGLGVGPYKSGLGGALYPKTEHLEGIKRLAKPTPPLSRFRWRILQLMNLYSSQLASNSVATKLGFEEDLLLQLQRLALLISDVCFLFDDSLDLVEDFVEEAKKIYLDAIRTCSEPISMCQPSELPRMQKEDS